jgi:hypothetical protein
MAASTSVGPKSPVALAWNETVRARLGPDRTGTESSHGFTPARDVVNQRINFGIMRYVPRHESDGTIDVGPPRRKNQSETPKSFKEVGVMGTGQTVDECVVGPSRSWQEWWGDS